MELRKGRQVIVHGLQKNPEKNGAIGTLVEFNKEKGRWVVDFAMGTNNFKPENLRVVQESKDEDDDTEPPTCKIYISRLSADVTEDDLIELFGSIGQIAKVPV